MMTEVDQEEGWRKLRKVYAEKGLTLVLGSGVSRASRIPLWKGLIQGAAQRIPNCGEEVVKSLTERGYSLQVIASLLEERSPGKREEQRKNFVSALRQALYDDFLQMHGWTGAVDFSRTPGVARRTFIERVRDTRHGNSTLRAVGSLCAIKSGEVYARNPNVHAVVTQNVDWLLQAFARAHFDLPGDESLLRTIEQPSAGRSSWKVPVYHMHGLLRFDSKQGRKSKEAQDRVVITEQDYYDFFNDPTSIFNYTVLHLLREQSCLFIGLSMVDDNLRRLLHYSKRERAESLESEGKEDDREIRRKVTRHFAILPRSDEKVEAASKDTLAPLGVRVLWVDSFADIPRQLQTLYDQKHGAGHWAEVYRGARN